jgi:hypothetical protein
MPSTMPISFTFALNEALQLIEVVSAGTWSLADAERYAAEFRRHVGIARERFGRVRALVDGRDAVTQDAEVRKLLSSLGALFDGAEDRFAVVTPTSLRKQQAGRDGLPGNGMAFVSPDAARTWLFAYD